MVVERGDFVLWELLGYMLGRSESKPSMAYVSTFFGEYRFIDIPAKTHDYSLKGFEFYKPGLEMLTTNIAAEKLSYYGIKENERQRCPIDDCHNAKYRSPDGVHISTIIFHLNDNHNWTFKQIGLWLKSIGH